LNTIKLGSLYNLKIYLTKYLATKIVLIKFIKIIYRIFVKQLTTTIIFINLLLLDKAVFSCKTSDQIRTESPAEKDAFLPNLVRVCGFVKSTGIYNLEASD
jgi:hypothetical protein